MRLQDQCIGKWPGILIQMGVDKSFLKNSHGPCPFCGGKDRFRFDDKGGKGTFFCNMCGSGDGFDFAMKFAGEGFKPVARKIEGLIGAVKETTIKKQIDRASIVRAFTGLRHISVDDPVHQYIKSRGLNMVVGYGLRYHPGLRYYLNNPVSYPAMVALIEGPNRERYGYHATYLGPCGKADVPSPKKIYKVVESISGGIIRLSPVQSHIAITEGIENALAVMQKEGVACWASATAGMLERAVFPEQVKRVTIYADNDRSHTGQASAHLLAKRLVRDGVEADVIIPGEKGQDYLDCVVREIS